MLNQQQRCSKSLLYYVAVIKNVVAQKRKCPNNMRLHIQTLDKSYILHI